MDSDTKLCPVCGLLNPDSALACRCGHNFEAHDLKKPLGNQRKTVLEWWLLSLKNLGVRNGRSQRKEYWMFFLFAFVVGAGLDFTKAVLAKG